MLIKPQELISLIGVAPKKVLHLGAYHAEERDIYQSLGVERTIWVEADPINCEIARNNLKYYVGHMLIECAMWKEDGKELTFHVCNNRSCSSLKKLGTHRERYPHIVETGTIQVKTRTIDSLCAEHKFKPNLINLDLQGLELEALSGGYTILSSPCLQCIYTEVSFEELYEGCALMSDIDAFLNRFQFERIKLFDTGCGWGDTCYIRE